KAELEAIAGGPVFLMSGVSREGVEAVLRVLRHEIDAGRKQETRVEQEDLEWRP
ncbi:MAG TPA: GTPase ObgE, partial [Rhodobacteraceae bacterium]|nr:GTPase ObgE [Paracoccaceae bacterium]